VSVSACSVELVWALVVVVVELVCEVQFVGRERWRKDCRSMSSAT